MLGHYELALPGLLGTAGERVAWFYSPLPVELAASLDPDVLVYDVMDDLASFHHAPRHLVMRQRQALQRADVVFAGGRTLHRNVVEHRPDVRLLPSGVEPEHYAAARSERGARHTAVAGYVGVIDLSASISTGRSTWWARWPRSKVWATPAGLMELRLDRRAGLGRELGDHPAQRHPGRRPGVVGARQLVPAPPAGGTRPRRSSRRTPPPSPTGSSTAWSAAG
ncbi:MAG: hypothetical protein M3N25_01035 [Actinomycetota bacterium]|nr:hypothetical protein [Actinomycetota bacterium]